MGHKTKLAAAAICLFAIPVSLTLLGVDVSQLSQTASTSGMLKDQETRLHTGNRTERFQGIAPAPAEKAEMDMPKEEPIAETAAVQPPVAEPQPVTRAPSLARQALADRKIQNSGNIRRFMSVAEDDGTSIAPDRRRRAPLVEANSHELVADKPVSTFSIDVDTAAYARVRRMLNRGTLPAPSDVRVEEMVNYFNYDYPLPQAGDVPFRTSLALYPTPWNADTRLLHIGIKGRDVIPLERPRANLVFLIDTSGSMQGPDRLPLLKTGFRLLVDRLEPDDTVAIVTYAGKAGTVLEPTKVARRAEILAALDKLSSGGSTAGHAGIAEAYRLAEKTFDPDGVNRVMLATDGDFNVGMTDLQELKTYIAGKRKSGVFLSVLGFGQDNTNDALMQVLAQNGNGTAAYIDTLKEAEKVLVTEATSALFPIARDVKVQVEFNPALVSAYRLVGYETRLLRRQDFNNDRIDAGEIGSGHTVTALYELTLAGADNKLVDDLRYGQPSTATEAESLQEFAFVKLRYKPLDSEASRLIEMAVTADVESAGVQDVSADMRFAASVAAFGQKLRGDPDLSGFDWKAISALADGAKGSDPFGFRSEFVDLVRLAGLLNPVPSVTGASTPR